MVSETDLTQGIALIDQNLLKVNNLKDKLRAAVKDEHDAQDFYSQIINMAQGMKFRDDIPTKILRIKQDEWTHETVLNSILQNLNEVVQNMKNERERLDRERQNLRKSQVKDPNRRYGR